MILEEVFRKIIEICRRNGASKVILFGSRAKETARERSDIDIAVCGVYDMEKTLIGHLTKKDNGKIVNLMFCK